jgi:glycosyltransferase involved in cell wall biosynthesis
MTPISVIMLTFNEEANLPAALDSVRGWAREVFVVDSYSTDRTVEIALAREDEGVRVVQHPFENYSAQWSWALARLPITQPWVMKLDADERATEAFQQEVTERIVDPGTKEAGFIVHWRLIFMGRWLRWGGLYPNGNLRIWRRGAARLGTRAVNEHIQVEGPVGRIREPIDHGDQKSLTQWIDRHNRYASLEAREMEGGRLKTETEPRLWGRPDQRRMWLRNVYNRMPARPFLYFVYCYLFRLGFLDGRVGFRYCFLRAAFFYWIDLKHLESRRTGEVPEVVWPPRGEAHPALLDSPLQRQVDGRANASCR